MGLTGVFSEMVRRNGGKGFNNKLCSSQVPLSDLTESNCLLSASLSAEYQMPYSEAEYRRMDVDIRIGFSPLASCSLSGLFAWRIQPCGRRKFLVAHRLCVSSPFHHAIISSFLQSAVLRRIAIRP